MISDGLLSFSSSSIPIIYHPPSEFAKEAIDFANKHLQQRIVLVDGNQLTNLMVEYDLGVSVEQTYVIKKVDYDFFNDYM